MYHILPILSLRFDHGMAYSIILTKKQVQSDLFILLRFITGETSLRVDANLKNICYSPILWHTVNYELTQNDQDSLSFPNLTLFARVFQLKALVDVNAGNQEVSETKES